MTFVNVKAAGAAGELGGLRRGSLIPVVQTYKHLGAVFVAARPAETWAGSPRPKAGHKHYCLRRPRGRPCDFQFHLVLFPTAHFSSGEELSVITEIVRAPCGVRRLVKLLPYPALS